jgi:hypothetical protein
MIWASLLLITVAVARVTRLIAADRITVGLRRWVVNRWGEESEAAYLIHCRWCASIWIALPAAIVWAVLALPLHLWWLALPAWLGMSHVTGLLSRLEEQD